MNLNTINENALHYYLYNIKYNIKIISAGYICLNKNLCTKMYKNHKKSLTNGWKICKLFAKERKTALLLYKNGVYKNNLRVLFCKERWGRTVAVRPVKIFLYKFVKIKLREKLIITYVIRGGR